MAKTRALSRREWLSWLAACGVGLRPRDAAAEDPGVAGDASDAFDVLDLRPEAADRTTHRARVFVPRVRRPDERLPVLVLLHGLAETESEEIGARAWSDRYGLLSADHRLRRPPMVRERPSRYLSDDRLAKMNAKLGERPFRGFIVVCPYTPNVYKERSTARAVDRYATWVREALLPAVRSTTPARGDPTSTAIDGCSLGGYVALEVFLRTPEEFGAVGGVQTAIGETPALLAAQRLRETISRVGARAIHIETSVWDPSLKVHQLWSARLRELDVPHEVDILPGGHDQIFLREVGTLEMLLWHDRRMPA